MNKGIIMQYVSIGAGALVTITLVSKHPIPVILLGICAATYFIGKKLENR